MLSYGRGNVIYIWGQRMECGRRDGRLLTCAQVGYGRPLRSVKANMVTADNIL